MWEAVVTFLLFFVLIILSYAADWYKARNEPKDETEEDVPVIEYNAFEIYKELINEKNGQVAKDKESEEKRAKMKNFIKSTMHTDQIDRINIEDLKKVTEGDALLSRIKYRKQVGNYVHGKRKEI